MNSYDGENESDAITLKSVDLPVGVPGKPYVISTQDGETFYIPLSKSSTRLLVTGKESENAFAVVASSGSHSDPIGFHFHRETHDVFLCLKGNVNVWAGDQCRKMSPGDFASVPPNTIHQYQILGDHSEMVGLIVPGGWEEFFRCIGEPYNGPLWPLDDTRNVFEVLIPRLQKAANEFDMVPCPGHELVSPSPWHDGRTKLPGSPRPYFLRNAGGPAYLVGGTVCRPLITMAESDGKFSIGSIEGSSYHCDGELLTERKRLTFDGTHHAFQIIDGVAEFLVGSSQASLLHASELIYVPAGTAIAIRFRSRYVKLYAFANGGGIVELLARVGDKYDAPIPPEHAHAFASDQLSAQQLGLNFFVG